VDISAGAHSGPNCWGPWPSAAGLSDPPARYAKGPPLAAWVVRRSSSSMITTRMLRNGSAAESAPANGPGPLRSISMHIRHGRLSPASRQCASCHQPPWHLPAASQAWQPCIRLQNPSATAGGGSIDAAAGLKAWMRSHSQLPTDLQPVQTATGMQMTTLENVTRGQVC
jgi:hypothetical protein